MGRRHSPGLRKRGDIWHIDKIVLGHSIRESVGPSLEEAERRLAIRVREIREAKLFGMRPKRTISQGLIRYCEERGWVAAEVYHAKILDRWVGGLALDEVHMGALQPMMQSELRRVKKKTVNGHLGVLKAMLRRAASEWIDENGLTWLHVAPLIKMLAVDDAAKPYPPTWEEERRLLNNLPTHYQLPALYSVNTGLRDQVVCALEWAWERRVPEIGRTVFMVPSNVTGVKNGKEWIVVHNRIAQSVIEKQRDKNPVFVFPGRRGDRLHRINNHAWRDAWQAAGLPTGPEYRKGPHNLRHAFSTRLRALGVADETRDYLMHHSRINDMSAVYSIPTLQELVNAVDQLCDARSMGATVLRIAG